MATFDIDELTGPGAPVEHCGKPMSWRGSTSNWKGSVGNGFEVTTSSWSCECGATLNAEVRQPS